MPTRPRHAAEAWSIAACTFRIPLPTRPQSNRSEPWRNRDRVPAYRGSGERTAVDAMMCGVSSPVS